MAIKIELIENALVVTDTVTSDVLIDTPAKEVYFDNQSFNNDSEIVFVKIGPRRLFVPIHPAIALADAVDTGDASFTAGTFRTFARTNLGKSSPGAAGAALTTFEKKADESITSDTVLTLDSDIQATLDANSLYIVSFTIGYLSDTAADFKLKFSGPSDAELWVTFGLGSNTGDRVAINVEKNFGTSPGDLIFTYRGFIETITGGTFGLEWAQNISNGNPTTVFKGSNMKLIKMS